MLTIKTTLTGLTISLLLCSILTESPDTIESQVTESNVSPKNKPILKSLKVEDVVESESKKEITTEEIIPKIVPTESEDKVLNSEKETVIDNENKETSEIQNAENQTETKKAEQIDDSKEKVVKAEIETDTGVSTPKSKKKRSSKKHHRWIPKKKRKRPALIRKLTNPSYVVEDVGNDLRVVLFVENDKELLKHKNTGEGKSRENLIKKLEEERDNIELEDVNFYYTDCQYIDHLCSELNINKVYNQVVYLTNYTITPIRMDYFDLQDILFDRLFNGLKAFQNIEYLNQYIETSEHKNVVLFNFETPPTEADLKGKTESLALKNTKKLIKHCRRDCFNYMTYVYLKTPDEFLMQPSKKGKVFLVHNGEFMETPFDMTISKKKNLKSGVEFLKNEGLEDVIMHNSRNYFKIYHNDYKAIVVLVIKEADKHLIAQVKREFGKTAYKHREFRKDYEDRYAFVLANLTETENKSNQMIEHVVGKQQNPFDIYLFNRSVQKENYDNFRLTQSMPEIRSFLNNLPYDLEKYSTIKKKKVKALEDEGSIEGKTSEEEDLFYEGAKKYIEEWIYINSALGNYEVGTQEDWDHVNERNVLGIFQLLFY